MAPTFVIMWQLETEEGKTWVVPSADIISSSVWALPPSSVHSLPALRKENEGCLPKGTRHRDKGCAMHLRESLPSKAVPGDRRRGLPAIFPFPFSHCRFQILWDEEIERVGPEQASLGRVVWKFQRTRVLMDVVANILCIIMAALGPVSGAGIFELSSRSPAGKGMSLGTLSKSWWL